MLYEIESLPLPPSLPPSLPLQPMKIHISKATADHLEGTDFIIEERGEVELKVCLEIL